MSDQPSLISFELENRATTSLHGDAVALALPFSLHTPDDDDDECCGRVVGGMTGWLVVIVVVVAWGVFVSFSLNVLLVVSSSAVAVAAVS